MLLMFPTLSATLQIAGAPEVKGQIKLKFKNRVNQPLVVVRNLQLSINNKGKSSFKALDSMLVTLVRDPVTGERKRVEQSSKCADTDESLPQLIGACSCPAGARLGLSVGDTGPRKQVAG